MASYTDQELCKIILAICTLSLLVKVTFCLTIQGSYSRRPPEDAPIAPLNAAETESLTGNGNKTSVAGVVVEPSSVLGGENSLMNTTHKYHMSEADRWSSIVRNDMESIPLGLIVFWAARLCLANAAALSAFALLYTSLRIGHTLFYVYRMQPWRSLSFIGGQLCVLIAGILMVIGALKHSGEGDHA